MAYVVYVRVGDPGHTPRRDAGPSPPDCPTDDFGFPHAPEVAGIDGDGAIFDTTAATVAADRETIHYHLRFGGRRRPYRLVHEGAGTYTSEDGTLAFRWGDSERFQQLDAVLDRDAPYLVSVRDVVQLEEPGGRFDWAVTRADFTDRSTDANAASLIYVVWRIGPPVEVPARCERGHPGVATDHEAGPVRPAFPADQTPSVSGDTILETTRSLIAAGRRGTGIG